MFITKKHLSRRTLLRSAGTALALPLLDAMIPARTALANTAAQPVSRLGCIYIPHGVTMAKWTPGTEGKGFEFPEILSPLEGFREQLCVISGLANAPVGPWEGEDSGGAQNHPRAAAAFLTGAHPVKGDVAYVGESLDQVAARHIGQDTPLPSVELAIEPSGLVCGSSFTCAYSNTLSWKTPTLPLPMNNNPKLVFEYLFGNGGTDEQRQQRRDESASLLDSIQEQVASLNLKLSAGDREKLSDYLDEVREIERRVKLVDEKLSGQALDMPGMPSDVPRDFEEHLGLMFDLQVLAYKSEITRISSLMFSRENSNTRYPGSGVSEGFHNASHHSNQQKNKDRFALINTYHVSMLGRFLQKLKETPDGDGNLLEHSLILYGSSLSDGNEHNFSPLPILLAGNASGKLEGGRHLRFDEGTPLANLHLGILDKLGIQQTSLGDSTGKLTI